MVRFLKNNSLSLFFFLFFVISLIGQTYFGFCEFNKEREQEQLAVLSLPSYLSSGHFISATFENWESEFLQMALFVWLTIFLFQKGSSESKKFDGTDEVDNEPDPNKKDAPWPVRKGGVILAIYKHSLTLSLLILFIISFILHFYGSLKHANQEALVKAEPMKSVGQYLRDSRFWFESFQNWQSEFLSVFAIVFLSIYLRQKGSPQSKRVDAPHDETGE